eukprot:Gb_23435 [translate_table: standard]
MNTPTLNILVLCFILYPWSSWKPILLKLLGGSGKMERCESWAFCWKERMKPRGQVETNYLEHLGYIWIDIWHRFFRHFFVLTHW